VSRHTTRDAIDRSLFVAQVERYDVRTICNPQEREAMLGVISQADVCILDTTTRRFRQPPARESPLDLAGKAQEAH